MEFVVKLAQISWEYDKILPENSVIHRENISKYKDFPSLRNLTDGFLIFFMQLIIKANTILSQKNQWHIDRIM